MTGPFNPRRAAKYPTAIGCDEVGRGALCGPVVVAAVWFDPRALPKDLFCELDDSKKITAARREHLARRIVETARVRVAAASSFTIDRTGIRTATLDAMRRAIAGLSLELAADDLPAYVDGLDVPPGLASRCEAVVRGDSTVPQIAASSIVAKTCRDRLMRMLGRRHPNYRWEKNAGYGTADHLDALARFGPTRHHRQSFRPVAQLSLGLEALVDVALDEVD
ncbi:MAG: ribonuclease HII [Rhizobiaceae bacterium]|nr:MAG: ribonuclease HII [Rhizobiaceae bacterium]CAG1015513.1 Ribonuclease HII [Rhizobiaceae bacterium]